MSEETPQAEEEKVEAAPAPAPAAPKPPRRGGGWLTSVVVLAFAIATVIFYFEWMSVKFELAEARNRGRMASVSVLDRACQKLQDASASLERNDFGDAGKDLQQALQWIRLTAVQIGDDAGPREILQGAAKRTEEQKKAVLELNKEAVIPELTAVAEQLKICQRELNENVHSDMQAMVLTRRYQRAKKAMEDAVVLFESSPEIEGGEADETLMDDLIRGIGKVTQKVGDATEKAAKGKEKIENKLEDELADQQAAKKSEE